MPMYSNIGGGSKQIASLYINKDGNNKALNNAYGNINGSKKEIFSKLYTWAKHTWKYNGSKSYVMGSRASNKTTSVIPYREQYLFRNCTPISDDTYRLSSRFTFNISTRYSGVTNSLIKYLVINGTEYLVYKQYNDESWHSISNGISYRKYGNDEYISFPTCYSTTIGNLPDSASSDPYNFKMGYYDKLYAMSQIYWNGPNDKCEVTYDEYNDPSYTCLWVPDTVQYVTSTDRNAYTENNTNVNVNSSYNYSSETTFPWNPTYRFIG